MKRLKNLLPLFLMALITSMTLVSCLDSDDDETMSQGRKEQCKMLMSGNYAGKLYWFDKNIDKSQYPKQVDSLQTSLRVSLDGTMTLYGFPIKLFFKELDVTANYSEEKLASLSDQQRATLKRNDEIVKAAEEYGTADLTMGYDFYAERSSIFYYVCQPKGVTFKLNYGGTTHDMAVGFVMNSPGIYANKMNSLQIVQYGIYDGKDSANNYMLLDGKPLYSETLTDADLLKLKFEFDGTQL